LTANQTSLPYTGSALHGFPPLHVGKPCTGLSPNHPVQKLSPHLPGPVLRLPASFPYLQSLTAEAPASAPEEWYSMDPVSEGCSHPDAGSRSSLWNCSPHSAIFPVRWYRRRFPL